MKPVLLVVAAALFDDQGRVLLAQRPEGKSMEGLWEFPGGKIETGETPEKALIRELYEELGIEIAAENLKPMKFASHSYEDFHLLMPVYSCYRWAGAPQSREGQTFKWVERHRLHDFPAPAADIPLFDYLAGCKEVEVP